MALICLVHFGLDMDPLALHDFIMN